MRPVLAVMMMLPPRPGPTLEAGDPALPPPAASVVSALGLVDDDLQPGLVLLVLGHLGEVEALEAGEHGDDGAAVVGVVLDGVAVEREAIEVRESLEALEVGKVADLVSVQVDHLEGGELEDVVRDARHVLLLGHAVVLLAELPVRRVHLVEARRVDHDPSVGPEVAQHVASRDEDVGAEEVSEAAATRAE